MLLESDDHRTYFCSNCKGRHRVWDHACPTRRAEAALAAAAYDTRPMFYKVVGSASSPAQTPALQFSSTPIPPSFTSNQGQPVPPTRMIRRWAHKSTVPAAEECAEDGSMAAPEQVGEMEGITPALPQSPSPADAPTNTNLSAFPPSSITPTQSQTCPIVARIMTAGPRSPSFTL